MKLFVTGASGFLGQYVVAEALRRGYEVRAVVRPAGDVSELPWADHPRVELARLDLRSKAGLAEALEGVDAVIHAAAAKSGDLYTQFAGTVIATENLIEAMNASGVTRIVGISTFSVYNYLRTWSWSRLDETSPIETDARDRDEYTITKLIQERLLLDQAKTHGWNVTILRPGAIYGKGNTWTARIGLGGESKTWICVGGLTRIPLTYVENCAEAIVLAAEKEEARGEILNIVDDGPPTQARYAWEVRRRMPRRPRILPLPWTVMRVVARLAWLTNKLLLRNRAKLPGILVPARLHARFKPLRYSNAKIKGMLQWKPRYTLAEALDRCFCEPSKPASLVAPVVEVLSGQS